MRPRIVAIVQARMGSSRLPGKVLQDVAGAPMLSRVVDRASRASTLDLVVVATTTQLEDDAIAQLCERLGYACFRGSVFDLLDRYYRAAQQYRAEVVVRLTADCPLIDPAVIDETVQAFFEAKVDFAANRLPPPWRRTFPIGLDVEVCSFKALERAWREAREPYQREHVMPYLYEDNGRFRVLVVDREPDLGHLRWTVDTPEDLELVRRIYAALGEDGTFSWLAVAALFERHPELAAINRASRAKSFTEVDERCQ